MSLISDRTVKVRKPCFCFGCGRPFQVGDRVRKVVWKGDAGLRTIPWCPVCHDWWEREASYSQIEDGISEGEIRDECPELFPDVDSTWRGMMGSV